MTSIGNSGNRFRVDWIKFPLVGLFYCHCGKEDRLNYALLVPERRHTCSGCGEVHTLNTRALRAKVLRRQ